MFRAEDILKLRVNKTNPRPSNNRYRFVRFSKAGDAVVVGVNSRGTEQYFNPNYLEPVTN